MENAYSSGRPRGLEELIHVVVEEGQYGLRTPSTDSGSGARKSGVCIPANNTWGIRCADGNDRLWSYGLVQRTSVRTIGPAIAIQEFLMAWVRRHGLDVRHCDAVEESRELFSRHQIDDRMVALGHQALTGHDL